MAHFASVNEESFVTSVVVVPDEYENNGEDFIRSLGMGGRWIQTSYNTHGGVHLNGGIPLRYNYAGPGYFYDETKDAFIPPKPEEGEWVLNEETCLWEEAE
jgi:hypothetical protein